jgi:uncharacterized protein YegP (UPF0339 family)
MKMRDARFEVYKDAKNEWRWRLISSNGNIIADSGGDGYKNRIDCIAGLKATNPNAPFNIVDTITGMGEHGGKRGRKKKNG